VQKDFAGRKSPEKISWRPVAKMSENSFVKGGYLGLKSRKNAGFTGFIYGREPLKKGFFEGSAAKNFNKR
jgi:hypothetical protein